MTGIDKVFDYALPPGLADAIRPGAIVRVPLHGRRVRGWVVELGAEPPPGVTLLEVLEVVSLGPPPAVLELARFAAWRYAGRLRPFLVAGSPGRRVRPGSLPRVAPVAGRVLQAAPAGDEGGEAATVREATVAALAGGVGVLRLPPAARRLPVVEAALAGPGRGPGSVLVVVPAQRDATRLAGSLRRGGHQVALLPGDWAEAAGGAEVVVGTRDAVLAPLEQLAALVVLDAHAESLVETRAPTWRADVLAVERARRAGVPCLLVSPCPTPEQAAVAPVVVLPRAEERAGWASLVVVDRRGDDPRSGLYSPELATLLRSARAEDPSRPVVCVLNRTGRARLLACGACGELARCEACGSALAERAGGGGAPVALACPRCGLARPKVCAACGSSRLKALRIGVSRAAEELAALTGLEVAEVSGPQRAGQEALPAAPLLVGTEAVLHRATTAALVVFLDIDQELLAPRLNAPVEALGLLALASRLVGGRRRPRPGPGRVVVQTRQPSHEVLRAARSGDPGLLLEAELPRRRALGLPPARAVAVLSGEGLEAARAALSAGEEAVETALVGPDRLLVRAADAQALAEALSHLDRSAVSARIEVDPLRL